MRDFLRFLVYGAVFAVPFVLLLVPTSMFFPYITGKNFAFRILVEVATAAWIVLALWDQAYRPRWSALLWAVGSLVAVMLVADIFGEYTHKSIWSNYERMEGWVTLVHFALYFTVLGVFVNTEKLWTRFFNTALVAAGLMSFYALSQIGGVLDVSQGSSWRVDAQLGNSSYLAVYMIFHMFIAGWLFLRSSGKGWRVFYSGLFILFAYIIFHTGTRGAVLGLAGGTGLSFLYLAIMAPKGAAIKKWAVGGVLTVVMIAGGLVTARDTEFVSNNEMLSRFANISLQQGSIRFTIWRMAWEGFKERPLLGWGQENYSYVFNKYYDPSLYKAEAWYDRTHNIFMDWLITGGAFGLLAYLSILGAALYHVVLMPLWRRLKQGIVDESVFTIYEQALLLGLLTAYMFHNLFVFDNLASWIFYAVILALIHSRVAKTWPRLQQWRLTDEVARKIALPVMLVVSVFVVYTLNVPGIKGAQYIIDAYKAPSVSEQLQAFRAALDSGTFADQEVVEQMAQAGGRVLAKDQLSNTEKLLVKQEVNTAIAYIKEEKPNDARIYVISALFHRMSGDLNTAIVELQQAEKVAPKKQQIINEQAVVYLLAGKYDLAADIARKSYEIERSNNETLALYIATLLYLDDKETLNNLMSLSDLENDPNLLSHLVKNPFVLQGAYNSNNYELLLVLTKEQIRLKPSDKTARINLVAVYTELGNLTAARQTLEQAIIDIPEFAAEGREMLEQF